MKGHLHLVTNEPPKPSRRLGDRPPPIFSPDEERTLRAAFRTAKVLFGTWACLADAMRVSTKGLEHSVSGRAPISADRALRLARALGVPVETLTRPGLRLVPFPKVCPTCGRGDP